jgi:hypothetical protein
MSQAASGGSLPPRQVRHNLNLQIVEVNKELGWRTGSPQNNIEFQGQSRRRLS